MPDVESAYLIRPDMHIAGRWYKATASKIIKGYDEVTFIKDQQA